jgi:glycosyltransferase involved in cell wall biosynthesis
MDKISIGAVLPNTKLFGGVRRFFELGKIWKQHGCDVVIFTPQGIPPDWFDSSIPVEPITNLYSFSLDAIFFTEITFLPNIVESKARLKILYHVGPRVTLKQVFKHPEIAIWVNSTNMLRLDQSKYGIEPVCAIGGVHMGSPVDYSFNEEFSGSNPFVVMAFGRLSRKGKGTKLVVKACEQLHKNGVPIKLLLFDTPIDEKSEELIRDFKTTVPFEFVVNHPVKDNMELFKRAHVFVSAESKGGWSNTSAEAMAVGVAVVGTKTGTADFLIDGETGLVVWRMTYFIKRAIRKLYENPALRIRLAQAGRQRIEQFSWPKLAEDILVKIKAAIDN